MYSSMVCDMVMLFVCRHSDLDRRVREKEICLKNIKEVSTVHANH